MDPYPEFPGIEPFKIRDHPGNGYQAKLVDDAGNSIVKWRPGMRNDFRDIRCHDDLGRIISYWIESQIDGKEATAWVKLTASKTVFLRWGNGGAVSESNGDAVFELFDGFSGVGGTQPDNTKWTCESIGAGGVIQLEGDSSVSITPTQVTASGAALISVQRFTQGITIGCRDKTSHASYPDTIIGTTELQPENGSSSGQWHPTLGPGITYAVQTGSGIPGNAIKETFESSLPLSKVNAVLAPYPSMNTYYIHEYTWGPSHLKWTVNGAIVAEGTNDLVATSSCRIGFAQGEYSNGNGGIRTLDWVYVRKYTSTGPTFTKISSSYSFSLSQLTPLFETTSGGTSYTRSASLTISTPQIQSSRLLSIPRSGNMQIPILQESSSRLLSLSRSADNSVVIVKAGTDRTLSQVREALQNVSHVEITVTAATGSSRFATCAVSVHAPELETSRVLSSERSTYASVAISQADVERILELFRSASESVHIIELDTSTATGSHRDASCAVSVHASEMDVSRILDLSRSAAGSVKTPQMDVSRIVSQIREALSGIPELEIETIFIVNFKGFDYPLTVIIVQKQRTTAVQKNIRTVTIDQ